MAAITFALSPNCSAVISSILKLAWTIEMLIVFALLGNYADVKKLRHYE